MENSLLILIRVFLGVIVSDGIVNPEIHRISTENNSSIIIKYGEATFSTDRILKTAPELFRLMNFELLECNQDPEDLTDGVLLPLKSKQLLFGNDSALGKILTVDSFFYHVIGVVKDVPERSCLCSDIIIVCNEIEVPFETLAKVRFSIMY